MYHPPRKNPGRWKELRETVAPSESASQRGKRRKKRERRNKKASNQEKLSGFVFFVSALLGTKIFWLQSTKNASGSKKVLVPETGPDLPGSDLNPPDFMIHRSIRLVEAWLDDCEEAMAIQFEYTPTSSMVSLLGGGVIERPSLDVDSYQPLSSKGRSTKFSFKSIFRLSSSSSRYSFKPPKVRDCVYDKFSQSLNCELVEGLNNDNEKRVLGKLKGLKGDRDESNGVLSREHSHAYEEYDESELFMTGGRNPGLSASLDSLVPQSEKIRVVQISMSGSDVGHCLCQDTSYEASVSKLESCYREKGWTFESPVEPLPYKDKSSLSGAIFGRRLSGDDSTLAVGFPPKRQSKNILHSSTSDSTMSSPARSRASSFNIGSIIERSISIRELEEREERERLDFMTDRAPSPVPFRPSPPRPIEQQSFQPSNPNPLRRKPSIEDFKFNIPESVKNAFTSPSKQPLTSRPRPSTPLCAPGKFVREQMAIPGVVGQGIQAFVTNRERRRADRASDGAGEFTRAEDERARMDEGTAAFTKNRERRRAERYSAGRVMEMKDEHGAISGGEKMVEKSVSVFAREKKRDEGEERRVFKVEDEPVASGAAWERRIKKGQLAVKKPPSEKYREEERAKYWSPK
jgi:hypothetical protein